MNLLVPTKIFLTNAISLLQTRKCNQRLVDSQCAGTTIWTIRASDADSDYRDYGKVRFYYDGNQQPPSSTQYFGINEQGDVSLLSSIDRETVESVSFRVLAKDGLTSGKIIICVIFA